MTWLELLQQDPAAFVLTLIVSFIITVVAYGAFPLIFAMVRNEIITKKKYNILCFAINFVVMVVFIAINGEPSSGGPYLLWTWVFSTLGIKIMKNRGVLEGFLSNASAGDKVEKSSVDTFTYKPKGTPFTNAAFFDKKTAENPTKAEENKDPKYQSFGYEKFIAWPTVNISPLLKRAFIFLEDGEFERADEFLEHILNQDPENAQAYLGKLMVELRIKRREDLADCEDSFDNNNNYKRAVQFADATLASELKGYVAIIEDRNARRAEEARKNTNYLLALDDCKSNDVARLQNAIKIFTALEDYKDSSDRIAWCHQKIDQIHFREENERIERERLAEAKRIADEKARLEKQRQAEIERIEAERRAKRNKKIAKIATPIVCAVIVFIVVLNTVIIPNAKYKNALALMNEGRCAEAIDIFEALDDYKDSTAKIEECNTAMLDAIYDKALSLMSKGDYGQAISVFKSINNHRDSAAKINECQMAIFDGRYDEAIALMNKGQYSEAIAVFQTIKNHRDSTTKIDECKTAILDGKYNDALRLMISGKYSEAISAFDALDGYRDSSSNLKHCIRVSELANLKNRKVGDYIKFGSYEQDNNTSNGKENIEWLVLDKKNDKIFVISKYALDCQQYDTHFSDVTWENCTLRKWLNNDFINSAFSADEKGMISTATLFTNSNPTYGTNSGNATKDKIFLLDITEAYKYFSYGSKRQCETTDYATEQGASCWWWLRSPGISPDYAACVDSTGQISNYGRDVGSGITAVRPAMWIDLNP